MPTANLNKIKEFLTLTDYIIIIVSIIALLYILMIMFPSLRQLCGCVETMDEYKRKTITENYARLGNNINNDFSLFWCYEYNCKLFQKRRNNEFF